MAWPNTPLTTYLAGGLPYIKAADLNSFQSAINGIINATYSLAAVVVDGTGGSVVVPVAGTVKPSATASAAGAGTAVAWGLMYKESALFGGATITAAGAISASFNAKSIAAHGGGSGFYEITFNGAPTNITRCRAQATGYNNGFSLTCEIDTITKPAADLVVTVKTWDAAGLAADGNFMIEIWGG